MGKTGVPAGAPRTPGARSNSLNGSCVESSSLCKASSGGTTGTGPNTRDASRRKRLAKSIL
eukprot:14492805-Alexandrium_andersonii.AAC.1